MPGADQIASRGRVRQVSATTIASVGRVEALITAIVEAIIRPTTDLVGSFIIISDLLGEHIDRYLLGEMKRPE